MNVLDLLLGSDEKQITALPEKEIKVKRLSEICGEAIVFKVRALSYSRVQDIKSADDTNMSVHIVLAGVTEPSLKDKALMDKFGAATPAELVKKILSAGEIEDVSQEIEKLSGFRQNTVEEIKKK